MAGKGGKPSPDARETLRIDKWLWHARFFKSRGLAAEIVSKGRVRLNGQRIVKPGHGVGAGDVLTLPVAQTVRLIRVLDLGTRRGPAPEAQTLYLDLDETQTSLPPLPLE